MQDEELLNFAHEDEEPALRERYVPDCRPGCHGGNQLVLIGLPSRDPLPGVRKYPLTSRSEAEGHLKLLHGAWEKKQLAKKLEAEAAKKKK